MSTVGRFFASFFSFFFSVAAGDLYVPLLTVCTGVSLLYLSAGFLYDNKFFSDPMYLTSATQKILTLRGTASTRYYIKGEKRESLFAPLFFLLPLFALLCNSLLTESR